MPFSNDQELNTSIPSDIELEAKREGLLVDISSLQERIRLLKEQEQEMDTLIAQKEPIVGEIKELSSELEELQKQFTVKSEENNSKLTVVQKEFNDLSLVRDNASKELDEINKDISLSQETKKLLEKELIESQKELDYLSLDVEKKNLEFKILESRNISEMSKSEEIFSIKKKEIADSLDAISEKEISLQKSIKDIEEQEKNLLLKKNDILDSISNDQNRYDLLKKEEQKSLDDIILQRKTIEDEFTKRELQLTEREGAASSKEGWLLEKEETLRSIKLELEKFYNRPIKNVII